MFSGKRDVSHSRNLERLAVVERFKLREFLAMLVNQVRELPHHLPTLRSRYLRPRTGFESSTSGFHRAVNVFLVAFRDVGQHFARRGIVSGKSLSGSGFNPLAVYQHLASLGYKPSYVFIRLYSCCRSCHITLLLRLCSFGSNSLRVMPHASDSLDPCSPRL